MRWIREIIVGLVLFLSPGSLGLVVEHNASVSQWIENFLDENSIEPLLEQAQPYKKMVEQVLVESGLPNELFYLGMIESNYRTSAESDAGAVGIWQFTRATAALFGLRMSAVRDDRKDACRSTKAAARYLEYLFHRFDSWNLAVAAYNAGEGRLQSAILRAGSRDFWTLAKKRLLPLQTIQFVPKFHAAVSIGKNPSKYGVELDDLSQKSERNCL